MDDERGWDSLVVFDADGVVTVVVTGGAGYIGSHVALELIAAGHEPVLFDNFSNSSPAVLSTLERLAGRPLPCVEGDIRERGDLDRVFGNGAVSAVLHLAASKAVGESVDDPLHYYANNLAGSVCLAERMAHHGVRTLVFSSTAAVYAGSDGPLSEDAPTAPSSPYGRTKLAAEQMLRDLHGADPRWSVSILRYFNVAGAHPSGLLLESPVGPPQNLLPRVADAAAGESGQIPVFGDDYATPDGSCVRDYVHVLDVAGGHVSALERADSRSGVSVHNLGSGCGHSVFEVLAAFRRASGAGVPHRVTARRPGDVAVLLADVRRARDELGWVPERGLDAICADLWRSRSLASEGPATNDFRPVDAVGNG
ncbi:MAG: UDP-glucose 4-epimerase GalE [Gammaproteobacteria bacterium]|nr:UDP-glucose 4-epimerase GalE [Gammaproteobacteria bacterium]